MDTNITVGTTFQRITIQVDSGMGYRNCTFIECAFAYSGMNGQVKIENCTFQGNCPWMFNGPAANTLSFLTQMYAAGNKEMIENLFQSIRNGAAQLAAKAKVPPPTPQAPPNTVQ